MKKDSMKTRGMVYVALAAGVMWLRRTRQSSAAPRLGGEVPPRPPRPDVPPLHFGSGSRKKARNTRWKARLGIAGLAAALIGVPGANAGWNFVSQALSGDDRRPSAAPDLGGVTTSESAARMLRFRGNLFQSRPTPSPTPTEEPDDERVELEGTSETETAPPPAPSGSITEIIYAAAAEFGIDPGYLVAVANCESGLNPAAVNPAGYHGLFQFDHATWSGYGYGSIYDPVAQARTAARMLAAGMAGRWPNCA